MNSLYRFGIAISLCIITWPPTHFTLLNSKGATTKQVQQVQMEAEREAKAWARARWLATKYGRLWQQRALRSASIAFGKRALRPSSLLGSASGRLQRAPQSAVIGMHFHGDQPRALPQAPPQSLALQPHTYELKSHEHTAMGASSHAPKSRAAPRCPDFILNECSTIRPACASMLDAVKFGDMSVQQSSSRNFALTVSHDKVWDLKTMYELLQRAHSIKIALRECEARIGASSLGRNEEREHGRDGRGPMLTGQKLSDAEQAPEMKELLFLKARRNELTKQLKECLPLVRTVAAHLDKMSTQ